jgi:ABC-2 type transport system permease protein
MTRIKHIVRKEFIQIRRDKTMVGIIFVMPIMQLLILGYVVSSEIRHLSTLVCDLDNSPVTRQVIERVRNSEYFDLNYFEQRQQNVRHYLDSGKASVALIFPRNFSHDFYRQLTPRIQVIVDGQDANTSTVAIGYINGILQNYVQERMSQNLRTSVLDMPAHFIEPEFRVWYNPNLEFKNYMVPGIAAFLLTMITSILSAMGLVREKEIGTLEQLSVTPIKRHEMILGKLIPFAILGLIVLSVAIAFAKLWYHIPIVGNLGLFAIFSVVYLFTTLGVGLFVSASSHTQQQAMFMTWFIMIFAFLMSGFLFPIENMPRFAQWLSYLNPLRYFMIVVRELFIKGAGLRELYWQGVALAVFGGVIFTFAALRFHKRMK